MIFIGYFTLLGGGLAHLLGSPRGAAFIWLGVAICLLAVLETMGRTRR